MIALGEVSSSVNIDVRTPENTNNYDGLIHTGKVPFKIKNHAVFKLSNNLLLNTPAVEIGDGSTGGTFETEGIKKSSFQSHTKVILNGSALNKAVLKLDGLTFNAASHTQNSIELVNNWEIARFDKVAFNAQSVSVVEDGITKYENKKSTFIKALGCNNSEISTPSWNNVTFNFTNGATYDPALGYSLDFSHPSCTLGIATGGSPSIDIIGPSNTDQDRALDPSGIFSWTLAP